MRYKSQSECKEEDVLEKLEKQDVLEEPKNLERKNITIRKQEDNNIYFYKLQKCKSSLTKYAVPSRRHSTTSVIISTPASTANFTASLYCGSMTDG